MSIQNFRPMHTYMETSNLISPFLIHQVPKLLSMKNLVNVHSGLLRRRWVVLWSILWPLPLCQALNSIHPYRPRYIHSGILPHSIPFPAVSPIDYLKHAADDILHILRNPQQSFLYLSGGNQNKEAYFQIASLLIRAAPRPVQNGPPVAPQRLPSLSSPKVPFISVPTRSTSLRAKQLPPIAAPRVRIYPFTPPQKSFHHQRWRHQRQPLCQNT